MRKVLSRFIWLVVLVAVFVTGICYAYTRDLYKGNNQAYVAVDGATGQVALTEGVRQGFVPGHDFDGISLLLDHTLAADLGMVRVSVYRAADDAFVMERSLPVAATTRERYTYLASNETITAEAGESFYAVVSYQGPASGLVTAATGEMPAEVADSCEVGGASVGAALAMGVVTDYQYDVRNVWLIIGADILFVLSIFFFVWNWTSLRESNRKGRIIFIYTYLGIITSILLFALSMTAERQYAAIPMGTEESEWLALRDGETIDAYVTLPKENVHGLSFHVQEPGYSWMDETLTVALLDAETNRVLQSEVYAIADCNGEVYYQFHDRYPAGTRLALRFTTQGAVYGDTVTIALASDGDGSNPVYHSGTLEEGTLLGTMYASAVVNSTTKAVRFYLGAVLIGLIAAFVMFRRNLPVLPTACENAVSAFGRVKGYDADLASRSTSERSAGKVSNTASRKSALGWLALTLVAGALIMNFVWAVGVRDTQDAVTGEMVSYSPDYNHDWVAIPTDTAWTQAFTVNGQTLSGIALMISDGLEDDNAAIAEATLHVQILDDAGNVLDEMSETVGDLHKVGESLHESYTEGSITARGDLFYLIPLHQDLTLAEGTALTIGVTADYAAGSPVLIAQNVHQEYHLMTIYRGYQYLGELYWISMIVMLVLACGMAVLIVYPRMRTLTSVLILAAAAGFLISLVIPPFCVPDEMAHIKMVYYLSNRLSGVYDAAAPNQMLIAAGDAYTLQAKQEYITIARYNEVVSGLFRTMVNDGSYVPITYQNTLNMSSIWAYLPAVMGFQIFRMLGFSCMTRIMVARWCSLAAALVMIYLGIRRCPHGRSGLMVMMLFPQLLQQIASCSYDAMIIGYSFLFVGYSMHLIEDEDRSAWDIIVALLAGMLVASNKAGAYYALLCILAIPILRRLYRRIDRRRLVAGGIMVAAVIGVYMIVASYVLPAAGVTEATAGYSFHDVLRDPMRILNLLEHTWYSAGDRYLVNTVGSGLGAREVTVPTYIVLGICLLWILAWRNDRESERRVDRFTGGTLVALGILGILAICGGFVIAMTHHGDTLIQGIQGRYFLPYVILISLGMPGILPAGHRISERRILHAMSLILMLVIGIVYVSIFGIENINVI